MCHLVCLFSICYETKLKWVWVLQLFQSRKLSINAFYNSFFNCWFEGNVSISPTFYSHLFFHKSFAQSFFVFTFQVWTFLAQEFWRKCAHKMLVKLTTCFVYWSWNAPTAVSNSRHCRNATTIKNSKSIVVEDNVNLLYWIFLCQNQH
jgi:hypothetical protein